MLGPAPAAQSYLNADKIIRIAIDHGVQAIHPGYGFLSENPDFAESCQAAGIAFIGPTAQQMRAFGLKHTARELAQASGVPLLPGTGLLRDVDEAREAAQKIGYPVILKSTAGGGGIGMRVIWNEDSLVADYASVDRTARANFKQAGLYIEKYVAAARHIEVQIFGDGEGNVIALGERDCSVQRRNQKVIEETPAPGLTTSQRSKLHRTAIELGKAVNYRSAGTVEFVFDANDGEFYFLEVNTRLQVEHGITEEVTGIDLVEWMVRLADKSLPPLASFDIKPCGAAMQVRLYAEDPNKNFQPSAGLLTAVNFPADIRVDGWVEAGTVVPANYDPMLAMIIARGADREAVRRQLIETLQATELAGIETNVAYLIQVLATPDFVEERQITRMLDRFAYQPSTIDVLDPGVQSTVQDWPGRQHYWDIGVPPSGPMDALSMRLVNRLVGNAQGAAALELTATGPQLKFNCASVIALGGAAMTATLDGQPFALWQAHAVSAGSVLKIGGVKGSGLRAYLAVQGGVQVPDYLGSKSTFTLGQFGGHGGRTLRAGDVLHIVPAAAHVEAMLLPNVCPPITNDWEIGVLYGPHGAPDFFTDADVAMFFSTAWEVHYNSSRTGVRLIGPKPQWARTDGGEAGLHPSNIHDNAYAIGAIDFTGDMPVILGPDGPSLGGFVCPATIIAAELWKMGQLKPGDTVRFKRVTREDANRMQREQDAAIAASTGARAQPAFAALPAVDAPLRSPIVHQIAIDGDKPLLVIRQSGDTNLLIELGPLVLDFELRFRIQALMEAMKIEIAQHKLLGILDLTPGIRSLQIHFDPRIVDQTQLIDAIVALEVGLPNLDDLELPSRIVHLPLSWDDAATRLAIERYMQSVRPDAPWCPSNIEFIRRINGLDSIDDVFEIVFDASYLVMGLGDVYLGAPVATPLDPRHRLVTTKYNPARTWTPENAVGIGGAYMCVYGMEGPGGYQFVGRTVQMWNRYRRTANFTQPWLLRFFDQIRFYPVDEAELLRLREDFIAGKSTVKIEPTQFRLRDYRQFLALNAAQITHFKQQQQTAFEAEREQWKTDEQLVVDVPLTAVDALADGIDIPAGAAQIATQVSGIVWKINAAVGDLVIEGQTVIIVESMKMEIAVIATSSGRLLHLLCKEGSAVTAGQNLLVIDQPIDLEANSDNSEKTVQ